MQFIEKEVCQYTQTIWKSILDLETTPLEEDADFEERADNLAGCVQITGAWEGTVALQCHMSLAKQVASIMFDVNNGTVSKDQIQDALGEMANMTGGNIKSLLPEPCYLSLPAVAVTQNGFRIPGGELVTQVTFQCNGDHFMVSLLKREEPTAK